MKTWEQIWEEAEEASKDCVPTEFDKASAECFRILKDAGFKLMPKEK
jgi:hypothetical protein